MRMRPAILLLLLFLGLCPGSDVGLGPVPTVTNSTLASPGPIGSTTPNTGKFTTLQATGAVTLTGSTFGVFSTTPAAQPGAEVDADTALATLGFKASGGARERRRFKLATGVDLNSANTDVATFTSLPAKYRPTALTLFDASTSLTTATVGLYTAAAAGGTEIITGGPSGVAGATTATAISGPALTTTTYLTGATMYFRCVTAQGSAATASVLFEYIDLTP